MTYRQGLAALLGCLALSSAATAADPILVLSLKSKVNGRVTSSVDFFNCERDPNVKSANCAQYVQADGKKVAVPEGVLQRLDNLRRSFSYDSQSGGIRTDAGRGAICRLGGPSEGMVLEARYLTYVDFKIVSDEMKPVFALGRNCLFTESYSAGNNQAREEARAVTEILETVREFAQSVR